MPSTNYRERTAVNTDFYNLLAPFYARLNGEVDYEGMADFIHSRIRAYFGDTAESVLDLGCGSGNVTLPLLARGYDMIGVDASADMLAEARAREGGEKILWLCQDMRAFELYGTVEAAVCTLDGINHLTKREDVLACLRLVHNYLIPNGIFIFDLNTPYKFKEVYGEKSYILEDAGVLCAWQNGYNEKSGLCRFAITLFEEQEDGSYLRADAEERERCYTERSIKQMLTETGFTLLERFDDYTPCAPHDETERLVLVARANK